MHFFFLYFSFFFIFIFVCVLFSLDVRYKCVFVHICIVHRFQLQGRRLKNVHCYYSMSVSIVIHRTAVNSHNNSSSLLLLQSHLNVSPSLIWELEGGGVGGGKFVSTNIFDCLEVKFLTHLPNPLQCRGRRTEKCARWSCTASSPGRSLPLSASSCRWKTRVAARCLETICLQLKRRNIKGYTLHNYVYTLTGGE